MKTHTNSAKVLPLTIILILAMLMAPLAVFAGDGGDASPTAAPTGRAFLDQFQGRQFPNEMPPRDEYVTAQAAGVPLGASPEEAKAITDAWLAQFNAKNEKSGPNPIAL
ncbi:MAG: hypothetical protein ACK2U9_11510, partial [Anaerolineae bacterium]